MRANQIIAYIEAYKINTRISPGGYCYGLACMARDAFLLGPYEYVRYQKRLKYMEQDDFLNQMKDFIQQTPLLTADDTKISAIPAKKLKQWPTLITYAAISLGKPEAEINLEDLYAIYLETRAFLETMTILFFPNFHQELFAKKKYIWQGDNETVLPLMNSCLAAQEGGIVEVNKFINIYSHEEIIDYLKGISSIQTEKRFAIMLSSISHTVTLLYNRARKNWLLDDRGYLYMYSDSAAELDKLSEALGNLLSKGNKQYTVSTTLYSLGDDKAEVAQAFLSFCQKERIRFKEACQTASTPELGEMLLQAAHEGDIDQVTALLRNPECNPNTQDKRGWTALHFAAQNGYLDIVTALLQHPQCNPNTQAKHGWTVLYLAAQNGHVDLVKVLLKHPQINLNNENKSGHSALQIAIKHGHLDVIQVLVEKASQVDAKTIAFAKSCINTAGDGYKNSKAIYVYLLNFLPPIEKKKSNVQRYPFFSRPLSKVLPQKKQSVQEPTTSRSKFYC